MQETKTAMSLPNRDQSLLKLVAIITMIVDHVGVIFFPGERWLRMIGREVRLRYSTSDAGRRARLLSLFMRPPFCAAAGWPGLPAG